MTYDPAIRRAMDDVRARIAARKLAERGSVETYPLIPSTQSVACPRSVGKPR
jgi:hypothetical protein